MRNKRSFRHLDSLDSGAWTLASGLRLLLKIVNAALALVGICALAFSVYMVVTYKRSHVAAPAPTTAVYPWFIATFGVVGAFITATAACGYLGLISNRRRLLDLWYSKLGVALLVVEAVALVATLINVRLHQHLPHDTSAEAQRIWKFVRRRLLVCQWAMAVVFGVQVLTLGMAYALSEVQRRELEASRDEEEEDWGRRSRMQQPLLTTSSSQLSIESGLSSATGGAPSTPSQITQNSSTWTSRLRDKYGIEHGAAADVLPGLNTI